MVILGSESMLLEYPHHNSMMSYYQDNGFGRFEEVIDDETNSYAVAFVYEGYDDFYENPEAGIQVLSNVMEAI